MRLKYHLAFVLLCICLWELPAKIGPLIPQPAEVIQGTDTFVFTQDTRIMLKDPEIRAACDLFLEMFRRSTGLNIGYASSGSSLITVDIDPGMIHPEAYHIKVTEHDVSIKAKTPAGVFYAFQTIRQLLPPEVESLTVMDCDWKIPGVEIKDIPRFRYRGLLLDVARHFFPVSFLKRYIDLMAMYKYNYLHLHLTDDQGWRIEIPAYPRLQTISAWRNETLIGHLDDRPRRYDGIRYGGYYKQSELKELVRYAAERYITIIPEIDMPGHATAVLAAYPELSCSGGHYEVAREWGVLKNIYCPKEETFLFLEKVLTEVMDIFPGEYIHLGGDEAVKEQWEQSEYCRNLKMQHHLQTDEQLQIWFMQRMTNFVNSKGRKVIGWDEIMDGGEIPGTTVMSWRGEEGGVKAARKGHDAIMTPHKYCYLDYYQWRNRDEEPLAIGGYTPLSKVYMYDPVPAQLNGEQAGHILGAQGNLFTEYIADERHAEYMAFPRVCALSEVVWSPLSGKSYDDFLVRLREHSKRLDILGVHFARHFLGQQR
ncbi:MAG: beta-N-acetylhexosaminidase [Bacteroidales bacterium]|jgi:hexosaminidase|nr:beta-N-acetylhexosaminidase [Bacteroidales bacterium]